MVARSSAIITSTRVSFDTTTIVVVTTEAMIPSAPARISMVMAQTTTNPVTLVADAPLERNHIRDGFARTVIGPGEVNAM